MSKAYITQEGQIDPREFLLQNRCSERIKPSLLREVKTEAVLVFARTALERFFTQMDEAQYHPRVGDPEDTRYIYETLHDLKETLARHVVNADYLIHLVQGAQKYPELRRLAQFEQPLIEYYDVMAQKVAAHYRGRPAYLPEFLVVCVMSHWILEEEHSIALFPFLKEIDLLELIAAFERHRKEMEKEEACIITDIHELSIRIVEKLQQKKFKLNTKRVSKSRKRK